MDQSKGLFPSFAVCNKLLMVNSFFSGASQIPEVFDLSFDTTICSDLATYPINTRGTHGGLLPDLIPIVCGGLGVDRCFTFEYSSGWTETYRMNSPRMHSTGMTGSPYQNTSHKYFILGGNTLKPEVLTDSGWEILNGNYPSKFYKSCLMVINETSFLVFEGEPDQYWPFSTRTFIFNAAFNRWTRGPELIQARRIVGCGLIRESSSSSRNFFIVAGGENDGPSAMRSVEILNDLGGNWRPGKCAQR